MQGYRHSPRARHSVPVLAGAIVAALAGPLQAQTSSELSLGTLIPTDAIRVEVSPDRLNECAPLMAWAFNLPNGAAGFGPTLPEVPVGYGPSCAVIPESATFSMSRIAK